MKACTEYVRRQYQRMSPEERKADQENWDRWSRYRDEQRAELQELRSRDYEDLSEEESADIFETAMHNNFKVGSQVIDAILEGQLS